MGDVLEIPLRWKDGRVRAHALVDPTDVWVKNHRWSFSHGYATRTVGRKGKEESIRMHRAILGITNPLIHVDHINGNRLDNRRRNLRPLSQAANNQHHPNLRRDNTSGYRGVAWNARRGKWHAQIKFQGQKYNLGYFDEADVAGRTVAAFRQQIMPYSIEPQSG